MHCNVLYYCVCVIPRPRGHRAGLGTPIISAAAEYSSASRADHEQGTHCMFRESWESICIPCVQCLPCVLYQCAILVLLCVFSATRRSRCHGSCLLCCKIHQYQTIAIFFKLCNKCMEQWKYWVNIGAVQHPAERNSSATLALTSETHLHPPPSYCATHSIIHLH